MLLSEALDAFRLSLNGVASPKTLAWYSSLLRAMVEFLGDGDVGATAVTDLRRWRVSLLNASYSVWTVHGYLRGARRFFSWLVDERLLDESPAARLEVPKLPEEPPKGISLEDLKRMIAVARSSGARDYAIVLFLADTGCRVGGLCGLKPDELDLERRRAIVHEKGAGGNGKTRTVYFGDRTSAALVEWLGVRPRSKGKTVFVGRRGPLQTSGVYQLFKRLARTAGVTGRWNPHSLRHGWARGALQAGADLATVSQILGHSSVEVTARFYGRFSESELARSHERFSWVPEAG